MEPVTELGLSFKEFRLRYQDNAGNWHNTGILANTFEPQKLNMVKTLDTAIEFTGVAVEAENIS